MKLRILILCLFVSVVFNLHSQKVTILADDYKQKFEGGGATCGLYLAAYNSMTEENQLLASKMLYEDIHLNYIRFFPQPTDEDQRFDFFANFVNKAKVYNPSAKVMICTNSLPERFTKIEKRKPTPDLSIPGVLDSIANYYYKVFSKMKARGIDIDYLEPLNEPKQNEGTLALLIEVVPKFKALLNDPERNLNNIKVPLVIGPSTWSTASPSDWIPQLKERSDGVGWNNLDVVSTHAYQRGTIDNYKRAIAMAEGKPFFNNEQTAKLQRDEDPGVDVLAEQFPEQGSNPVHVDDVSIAMRMSDLINAGGNAFFHFLTNNTRNNNAALLFTKFRGEPKKGPTYNGFRQVSSIQPKNSNRVGHITTDTENFRVVTLRHPDDPNKIYLHVTNLYPEEKELNVDLQNQLGESIVIKELKAIVSDETYDFETLLETAYSETVNSFNYTITGHSVNSFVITVEPNTVLSLDDREKADNGVIKIFPNPTKNVVTIIGDFNWDKSEIIVSDISSKVFSNIQFQPERISDNSIKISTTSWSPGIYLVTVRSDQKSIVQKIIKI